MTVKITFLVNDLNFFYSHRLQIAEAALNRKYEVVVGYGELGGINPAILVKKGIRVSFVPIKRGGMNIFKECLSIFYIYRFLMKEKPDILHLVTIKPYLYGGILGRLLRIPALVTAVSGLGTLFIGNHFKNIFLRTLLYPLFYFAFRHKNQIIILQNQDDANTLIKWGVLNINKIKFLKGSGVDLSNYTNLDEKPGLPIVCFASRLLADKGVYEFVSATKKLKKKGIRARFLLAGNIDIKNHSGLNKNDLNMLIKDGFIEYIGYQENISSFLANCHIVCLPSYREGFPKLLMEAAAAARAVVTTDVPGCREVIIPNKTGLLVPVKNVEALANALESLIINNEKRIALGRAGRIMAEKKFKIEYIVDAHMMIYDNLFK
jgi:glycosyltransferase involved in cell wall biosynthesis